MCDAFGTFKIFLRIPQHVVQKEQSIKDYEPRYENLKADLWRTLC